jgi:non-homologous end joining protein Ku
MRAPPVIDIMQALKQSMDSIERIPAKSSRGRKTARKRRKKVS